MAMEKWYQEIYGLVTRWAAFMCAEISKWNGRKLGNVNFANESIVHLYGTSEIHLSRAERASAATSPVSCQQKSLLTQSMCTVVSLPEGAALLTARSINRCIKTSPEHSFLQNLIAISLSNFSYIEILGRCKINAVNKECFQNYNYD